MSQAFSPHIPASRSLPELTLRSIVLGFILSAVLAAANTYLGLYAGMTVSASIPAAVTSMVIFRLFRTANILENNAVMTAASAGEALAAGMLFTLPALVLMGHWESFRYWDTLMIALCGGFLGVLFTVPLRQALVIKRGLPFPEGVAISEVLKSGEAGGRDLLVLAFSSLVAALVKYCNSAANLWSAVLEKATVVGGRTFLYYGMDLSPALFAVGAIVGLPASFVIFAGGAIGWWIAIPIYIWVTGTPTDMPAMDLGYMVWSTKIRYIGVGAMVIGGLWALYELRDTLKTAGEQALQVIRGARTRKSQQMASQPRTERNIPLSWVLIGMVVMLIPIFIIYVREIQSLPISIVMAIVMLIAGFFFSAVSGYMSGVVGASNNPVSGITIATLLFAALLLLVLLGRGSPVGPAAAILVAAVVCCAASMGADNLQDLKCGQLLGATPWKQQLVLGVGVIGGAVVTGPVLNLLNTAYGFGAKDAAHPQALAAPQATLMLNVSKGVFGAGLPWGMVFIGILVGAGVILIDRMLEARKAKFRMPVLAFAIGIYLPFELGSCILMGGILAWALGRRLNKMSKAAQERGQRLSLLFASGLITGESLMGIFIAIPIVLSGKADVFQILPESLGAWPGLIAMGLIAYWLYNHALTAARKVA